jgi:hypothetical protein
MSDANTTGSYIATVTVALLSSGGLFTTFQYFLNRAERKKERDKEKREEDKQQEKDRQESEKAEVDRRELLAEAQTTAQRAALESADKRYADLHTDYKECRNSFMELRNATGVLIDLVERILIGLRPNGQDGKYTTEIDLHELGEVRRTVNEARRRLR